MRVRQLIFSEKLFYSLSSSAIIFGSCFEFFKIAQGTGQWQYGFSFTWALIFVSYLLISTATLASVLYVFWNQNTLLVLRERLLKFRIRVFAIRWLFAIAIFLIPIYIFQFTVLGIIFDGLFTRLLVWLICLLIASYFLSNEDELITSHHFLVIAVLMGGSFAITAALRYVSDYPFSQGWSEGNRMWDYSIMFGRERYIYPSDVEIPVALDKGRQFVGGLPFLVSKLTIQQMRAWVGLLGVIPYLLVGITLFRFLRGEKKLYFVLIIWAYLFLNQGPIHPPLVLSACLVFLAWRSRNWPSLLLILISSYFASISRFTWTFAPTIWLLMLELSDLFYVNQRKIAPQSWIRLGVLTLFGLIGGVILPSLVDIPDLTFSATQEALQESFITPENIISRIESQPLLWDRLLPNPTYAPGILLGLLLAIGPVLSLVIYIAYTKVWKIAFWQRNALSFFLTAFFVVGLIISTKIGGGGDLHNMDMFFIGTLLIFAIALLQGGKEWLLQSYNKHSFVQALIIFAVVIPGAKPLQEMRGYGFSEKVSWLMTLTDSPNERALDMYPLQEEVEESIHIIQNEASLALTSGDILFMDQRQLLTFGYISNIPLVAEYDKKLLIERAFSENRDYFAEFYSDLEAKRFSLIIVQPLSISKQKDNQGFNSENNVWVTWVSRPLLCYYQVKKTIYDVNVQLLIPREGFQDCSGKLP
jgi:hypothetical protein